MYNIGRMVNFEKKINDSEITNEGFNYTLFILWVMKKYLKRKDVNVNTPVDFLAVFKYIIMIPT